MVRCQSDLVNTKESVLPVCNKAYHTNNQKSTERRRSFAVLFIVYSWCNTTEYSEYLLDGGSRLDTGVVSVAVLPAVDGLAQLDVVDAHVEPVRPQQHLVGQTRGREHRPARGEQRALVLGSNVRYYGVGMCVTMGQ